VKTVKNCSI